MSETTVRVSVSDLRPGDVLPSGSTIVGYDRIQRGGARYAVRRADGTPGAVVIDRRQKITVIRRLDT